MSKTVTISGPDGHVVITKTDDDAPPVPPAPPGAATLHRADGFTVGVHSEKPLDPASFVAGLFLGLLLYFIAQSWVRWQRHRPVKLDRRDAGRDDAEAARMAADVAALARRTATLETIVTDPAQRTAREIDALR